MNERRYYIKKQESLKNFEKSEIGSDMLETMSISEKIKLYIYTMIDPIILMPKPTKDYLRNCLKEGNLIWKN